MCESAWRTHSYHVAPHQTESSNDEVEALRVRRTVAKDVTMKTLSTTLRTHRPRNALSRIVRPTYVMTGTRRRSVVAITNKGKFDVTVTSPGNARTADPITAMPTFATDILADTEEEKKLLIRT